MVIGVRDDGTLFITSRCDEEHLVCLSMEAGNIPVTGQEKPHTSKTRLIALFDDVTSNQEQEKKSAKKCFGMALGEEKDFGFGFAYEYATTATTLGEVAQVYFEDGYIRHGSRPYKALDCFKGKFDEGTTVGFSYFHGGENQKFEI